MTTCNRCWPFCRSAPVQNEYEESKAVVRPPLTPANTLTTMVIAEGHTTITARPISDAESKRKFVPFVPPPTRRFEAVSHARFVSTEIVDMETALRQTPRRIPPRNAPKAE